MLHGPQGVTSPRLLETSSGMRLPGIKALPVLPRGLLQAWLRCPRASRREPDTATLTSSPELTTTEKQPAPTEVTAGS